MNERMTRLVMVTSTVLMFGACAMPRSGDSGGSESHDRGRVRHNDQTCTTANCTIDVRIDCDQLGACVAVVDPKVLLVLSVDPKHPTPKDIHWKIKGTNDYEFVNVEVIPNEGAFQCQPPGPHKKEAMCRDVFGGNNGPVIEYTVHVAKSSGGPELTVDPWIVNR